MSKPKPMSVEQIVERYKLLDKQAKDIAAEMAALKDQCRSDLALGKHETDAGDVTISPNRRFDEETAKVALAEQIAKGAVTPAQVTECWKTVLDSTSVKKIVAPAVYEACMREVGDPKVTIA